MELKANGRAGTVGRSQPGRTGTEPVDVCAEREAPVAGSLAATLDELLSTLSHELRGPLTTIKGSSRTLLRHGARLDPDLTRQLLQDIDSEADRLNRLVDNLLDLSRAGAGREMLRTEPTAVDVLIRRVVAEATPRAGKRRLRVRAAPNLPLASIDPVRIEQVLRNLLDNAVKFSPPTSSIDVTVTCQDSAVVIAVADEGPGIAAEYRERVFERFFRVQPEGLSVTGAGLGLAICRRFVELHGGHIEIVPSGGRGATFRVMLPLGEEPAS
jgi:two-component system, OmpR family, sensor histidine kinase KdpD